MLAAAPRHAIHVELESKGKVGERSLANERIPFNARRRQLIRLVQSIWRRNQTESLQPVWSCLMPAMRTDLNVSTLNRRVCVLVTATMPSIDKGIRPHAARRADQGRRAPPTRRDRC